MSGTLESRINKWLEQPGTFVTAEEREFIHHMRSAWDAGVGYGWMQQVIQWEWQSKDATGALGPEYFHRQVTDALSELESKVRAMIAEKEKSHGFCGRGTKWARARYVYEREIETLNDVLALFRPPSLTGGRVMDDADLRAAFDAHGVGETLFTRRMAIVIAHMAGTTPMAIVIRLERMGLLKPGSRAWFDANGGITKEHVAEALADLRQESES